MTSNNKTQIRWGRGIRSDIASGRNRILDAAFHCYQTYGEKTSIRSIACAAKISRPTVYRYFDTGDAILKAVIQRTADDIRYHLLADFHCRESFGDYVIDAMTRLFSDKQLKTDLRFLFEPQILPALHDALLERNYLLTMAQSLLPFYADVVENSEADTDNAADQTLHTALICECFSRFVISCFIAPNTVWQSSEKYRLLFRMMLTPLIETQTYAEPTR